MGISGKAVGLHFVYVFMVACAVRHKDNFFPDEGFTGSSSCGCAMDWGARCTFMGSSRTENCCCSPQGERNPSVKLRGVETELWNPPEKINCCWVYVSCSEGENYHVLEIKALLRKQAQVSQGHGARAKDIQTFLTPPSMNYHMFRLNCAHNSFCKLCNNCDYHKCCNCQR